MYGFYDHLENTVDENGLTVNNIFNDDERGFSMVQENLEKQNKLTQSKVDREVLPLLLFAVRVLIVNL